MGPAPIASSSIVDALRRLTSDIPDAQQSLNQEWLEAIAAFRNLWLPAAAAGLGSLVPALAPSRLVLQDMLLEVQVAIRKSRETGLAVNVGLLNASYVRRYAASYYSTARLQVAVRQVPVPPRSQNVVNQMS